MRISKSRDNLSISRFEKGMTAFVVIKGMRGMRGGPGAIGTRTTLDKEAGERQELVEELLEDAEEQFDEADNELRRLQTKIVFVGGQQRYFRAGEVAFYTRMCAQLSQRIEMYRRELQRI